MFFSSSPASLPHKACTSCSTRDNRSASMSIFPPTSCSQVTQTSHPSPSLILFQPSLSLILSQPSPSLILFHPSLSIHSSSFIPLHLSHILPHQGTYNLLVYDETSLIYLPANRFGVMVVVRDPESKVTLSKVMWM